MQVAKPGGDVSTFCDVKKWQRERQKCVFCRVFSLDNLSHLKGGLQQIRDESQIVREP